MRRPLGVDAERLIAASVAHRGPACRHFLAAFALPWHDAVRLGRALCPGRLPDFAWAAPAEGGSGVPGRWTLFGLGPREALPAASPRRQAAWLGRLAAGTVAVGPAPAGGFGQWPAASLAWPFAAEGPARPPWQPADAGLRTYALLLCGRPDGTAAALWRAPVPAAWQRWLRAGAPAPVPPAVRQAARRWAAQRARLGARLRALAAGRPPRAPAPMAPSAALERGRAGGGAFARRVARAAAACRRGPLEKVVLSERQAIALSAGHRFDPLAAWDALERAHPTARLFLLRLGAGRTWLGASPETLARATNEVVYTHALAGTARAAPGAAARLLAAAKDGHEHALVVGAIARALAGPCEQVGRAVRPRVARAGALLHLETPFRARLRAGRSLLDVLARLHPTPALGGHPRRLALARLRQEEPARGLYGGAVGWLGEGGGHAAVGIRAVLVGERRAWAFAGAGIVGGSVPAAEARETQAKMEGPLSALAASVRLAETRRRPR